MTLTAYPGLLAGFGAPYLNVSPVLTTGKVFFVDSSTGKSGNTGDDSLRPMATLAQALAKTRASKGDYVICMPGHAETTSAIAMSKAGVRVIGMGIGRNRPTFTSDATAADVINVTAANCMLENIRVVGAASNCTALVDLSSAATDFIANRCQFDQAATPLAGLTISGDRFQLIDCTWMGTANGPDRCVDLEAHLTDWQIIRPRALFGAFGLDNDFIRSAADAQVGYVIEDALLVGLDTLLVNFASSTATPPDGFFASGRVMTSAPIVSIETIVAAGTSLGMAFGTIYATDIVQTRGGQIPLTSAS